jgi:hypothetical protein
MKTRTTKTTRIETDLAGTIGDWFYLTTLISFVNLIIDGLLGLGE